MGEFGFILLILIIRLAFAVACAAIANSKGRSVAGWFFVGLLLDLVGIIICAVMPNLKQEAFRRQQVENEQRRLREQLRQERLKTEALRQHAQIRLDAHDRVLGVDTRTTDSLQLESDASAPYALPPVQALPGEVPPIRGEAARSDGVPRWYYELQGQTQGPVSEQEVRQFLRSGQLDGGSLLWVEGMKDWAAARMLPVFQGDIDHRARF